MAGISIDLLTGFLSFLFTLLILSYVVGDNPAFRVALHAFVGVSAGYITYVVFVQVIFNKLFFPLLAGTWSDRFILSMPSLILGLFLLSKVSANLEWLGRPVVAMLVGIGAAAAIGGAVLGTIIPQIFAATSWFDVNASSTVGGLATNFISGFCALLSTIFTLAYFQFTIRGGETSTGKRGWFASFFALPGKIFIAITLGAIFAGVLTASLTALVDRVHSLLSLFF